MRTIRSLPPARPLLHGLLVATLAIPALACRGDRTNDGGSAGSAGGTLLLSTAGDADLLMPPFTQSIGGRQVVDLVFDHLAEVPNSLNTVGDAGYTPRLAKSWRWAADSQSIAFQLDERARWHDGRPVRAADVKYSVDLSRDSTIGSPVAEYLTLVDSVTTPDSMTAVVWYKRRSPTQFYDLVYNVWVLPQHVYGGTAAAQLRTSELSRRPVGSGPFRFVRWDAGSRIELAADTTNYRGRPRLDRVIWSIAADPGTAFTRVTTGEADMYEFVPASGIARLQGTPMRTVRWPGFQYGFLAMNSAHPALRDVAVRRALSMAVDRAAMLRNVFDTIGAISRGPFPMSHPSADSTLPLPPFDVARAQQTLDSAGWRVGAGGVRAKGGQKLAFSILVPSSSKPRMDYAVLLQQAFKQVGADVRVDALDFPTTTQRLRERRFDAVIWVTQIDPHVTGARQYWASAASDNYWRYRSPAFDAMLDSADATYDPATAKRFMRRAYEIMIADAPAIWLYDSVPIAAIHQRFRTGPMRADGWWSHLREWTVPEGDRIPRDRIGAGAAPATAGASTAAGASASAR